MDAPEAAIRHDDHDVPFPSPSRDDPGDLVGVRHQAGRPAGRGDRVNHRPRVEPHPIGHFLRLEHVLAMLPQFLSMYLLYCICTNLLSIYTPLHVTPGSLKPSNMKITTVLLQLLMVFIVFPWHLERTPHPAHEAAPAPRP